MSEKRFRANFDVSIYDSETEEYISTSERGLEEIAKRMNEQQATIEQLQDLCGKSDYENAKLRLKNKELQDKIDMLCEKFDKCKKLKEENEQLRKYIDLLIKQKEESIDRCQEIYRIVAPFRREGMMSERFRVMSNESKQLYCIESVDGEMFSMQEIVDMLNSLEEENEQLRQQLAEKQEEEKLYAEEILKLREINQFNELGGDY